MRPIEPTFGEGLLLARALVAERPGQQPHHRVDHRQGRELAAGEHEVSDRELTVDA